MWKVWKSGKGFFWSSALDFFKSRWSRQYDRDFLSKGKWEVWIDTFTKEDVSVSVFIVDRQCWCWQLPSPVDHNCKEETTIFIMATCLSSAASRLLLLRVPGETCQSSFCHADNGQLFNPRWIIVEFKFHSLAQGSGLLITSPHPFIWGSSSNVCQGGDRFFWPRTIFLLEKESSSRGAVKDCYVEMQIIVTLLQLLCYARPFFQLLLPLLFAWKWKGSLKIPGA